MILKPGFIIKIDKSIIIPRCVQHVGFDYIACRLQSIEKMYDVNITSVGRITMHVIQHVHHLLNTSAVFSVLPNQMDEALKLVRQLVKMVVNAITLVGSFWVLVTNLETYKLVTEEPF